MFLTLTFDTMFFFSMLNELLSPVTVALTTFTSGDPFKLWRLVTLPQRFLFFVCFVVPPAQFWPSGPFSGGGSSHQKALSCAASDSLSPPPLISCRWALAFQPMVWRGAKLWLRWRRRRRAVSKNRLSTTERIIIIDFLYKSLHKSLAYFLSFFLAV